ncbi:MAG: glycosyltransferase [Knoellia sp.]
MHIALTFDAAYLTAAAACIDSLLEHHDVGRLHLWLVVADDVGADDVAAFTRQVGDRAQLGVVPAPAHLVAHLPLSTHEHRRHVSRATYLRMHLPHLLPPTVERVLHLDADTLCLADLSPLYDIDLGGAIVAAVRDPYLPRLSDMEGVPGIEAWEDVDPQGPSLTPAVMLVDCAAWRHTGITELAMRYSEDPTHACRYMDQDALNIALQGRWLRVGSSWGFARTSRVESAWGGTLEGLAVLHFLGVEKPWHDDFPEGDRRELFDRHRRSALAAQAPPRRGTDRTRVDVSVAG